MISQGLGNLAAPYGTNYKSAVDRETLPVSVAVYGEKVSISDAGKALADADAASSKLGAVSENGKNRTLSRLQRS